MKGDNNYMNVICPKCGKELNDYEINKLWCTNCNAKFKSIDDLYNNNPKFRREKEHEREVKQNFLISTGYQFEGYTIDKYYNLLNSEVVIGTGALSELNAKISDILGSTADKFELKLQDAKEQATKKIIDAAIALNSNAVIGFRYDIFALSNNIISVSAYATAVHIIKSYY